MDTPLRWIEQRWLRTALAIESLPKLSPAAALALGQLAQVRNDAVPRSSLRPYRLGQCPIRVFLTAFVSLKPLEKHRIPAAEPSSFYFKNASRSAVSKDQGRNYIALWPEYRRLRSIKPDRPAKIVAISAQLRNLG